MKNVALITGASSGIGKEFTKIHAAKGGDVVIVARSTDKLNELKKELSDQYGTEALVISADLTNREEVERVYATVKEKNITIDYLINNAGFGGHGLFHERELDSDIGMIQLNIIALTILSRKILPDMVKRNKGRILNVSSTASLLPGPLQAVYFATKAYVTSLSNAIAEELHDSNVTVTALLPGATETGFASTADMDDTELFKNAFSAREVAQSGYDAMLEGKLEILAGVTFTQKIMMKSIPFTPKKILMKQIRKMQEK